MIAPHIDGSRHHLNGPGNGSSDLVWTARQPGVNGVQLGEREHTGGAG
jgi:hypothetical protein